MFHVKHTIIDRFVLGLFSVKRMFHVKRTIIDRFVLGLFSVERMFHVKHSSARVCVS